MGVLMSKSSFCRECWKYKASPQISIVFPKFYWMKEFHKLQRALFCTDTWWSPGRPRSPIGQTSALAWGPHRDQTWARSLSCQLWRDSPVQPSPPSLVSMNSGSRSPCKKVGRLCPYKLCVGAGMWVDQSEVSAGGGGWSFLGGAGEVCSVCSWGRSSPRAGFGGQPISLSDYSVFVCGGG